jgi:cathepsin E
MFLVASLVPFVVLANIVVANPTVVRDSPISLQIARQISNLGAIELVKSDQHRARRFVGESRTFPKGTLNVSVTNNISYYVANVGVGIPPTYCVSYYFEPGIVSHIPFSDNLQVDTGSPITWVGAIKPYVKTNTSVKTHNSMVRTMLYFQFGIAQIKTYELVCKIWFWELHW